MRSFQYDITELVKLVAANPTVPLERILAHDVQFPHQAHVFDGGVQPVHGQSMPNWSMGDPQCYSNDFGMVNPTPAGAGGVGGAGGAAAGGAMAGLRPRGTCRDFSGHRVPARSVPLRAHLRARSCAGGVMCGGTHRTLDHT